MPIIHFAHANGFPAASYKKLWQQFPRDWNIIAKDKFGHDDRYPVSDNWQNQVEELIEFVEQQAQGEPVYAVGHSFGSVISFMACCRRPELFRGLIMMDPPLLIGAMSPFFQIAKKTPFIDHIVPSGKSKKRKAHWHHDEDVLAYFKPKALFRYFDEDCLVDYVRSATKKEKNGTRLAYEVAVETQIFRNIPHNMHTFDQQLQCPAKLISAQYSNACFAPMIRRFLKGHPGMQHHRYRGVGHMFPFEKPLPTSKLIVETINEWSNAE
ncbi:MAG: alpha/beta fold hydrolase [Alteromonadaceae bacterium]|nr:alpha/beta fold hydrolase [Alteromonadaceae bacterium]